MRALTLLLAATIATTAQAQWQIQDSHTTASLRGIHALGNGVAWASGTQGTVLHTTDDGATWQTCTTPPEAEKLDFRGIQAFDANTAIVMSSGKGYLSRLYKTTDACKTWRSLLTNPDKEGFWDAIKFDLSSQTRKDDAPHDRCFGAVLGDPIGDAFVVLVTYDCGEHWQRQVRQLVPVAKGEAIFAASNSSLVLNGHTTRTLVTGGLSGPRVISFSVSADDTNALGELYSINGVPGRFSPRAWSIDSLPYAKANESSGAFSIAQEPVPGKQGQRTVIVGGNYKLPDDTQTTAWFIDSNQKWQPAQTPPHGYRSAVAYDTPTKTWITVGPNGTDISTNDGRDWHPLIPAGADTPDADKNWNALSLPFVVGPKGRIAKLDLTALKP
jgi:hypothetical protein